MSASTSPVLSKLFSVGTINTIIGGARGGAGGKRAGYVAEKCARTRGLQPQPYAHPATQPATVCTAAVHTPSLQPYAHT